MKYTTTRKTQFSPSLNQILERLSISEEDRSYRTSSQEDYKLLVEEALSGRLDGIVSV